jgi:hypothetical protein
MDRRKYRDIDRRMLCQQRGVNHKPVYGELAGSEKIQDPSDGLPPFHDYNTQNLR